MNKMCKCKGHKSNNFSVITNLYCNNFIPTNWGLNCKTLDTFEEERYVNIIGCCNKCGGEMLAGTSLPYNRKGHDLLDDIYGQLKTYRPFRFKGYTERENWYINQDTLSVFERVELIKSLFKGEFKEDYNSLIDTWASIKFSEKELAFNSVEALINVAEQTQGVKISRRDASEIISTLELWEITKPKEFKEYIADYLIYKNCDIDMLTEVTKGKHFELGIFKKDDNLTKMALERFLNVTRLDSGKYILKLTEKEEFLNKTTTSV